YGYSQLSKPNQTKNILCFNCHDNYVRLLTTKNTSLKDVYLSEN
ncbi:MAG: hypothetical protein ACI85O_003320, partial [Saprospiraceae bacterium]